MVKKRVSKKTTKSTKSVAPPAPAAPVVAVQETKVEFEKIIPKILAEAAKLYYVKNMEIIDKPEPSSMKTYNATYPAYISDFQTSDDADGIGRWFFSKIY